MKRDAAWHVSVEERNARWATNLFNALMLRHRVTSVLEIGCATATLLNVARSRGMRVAGFDTNPYAQAVARDRHNINTRAEMWGRDALDERFDLVVCISVMEHLTDPGALMAEIAGYCLRHGSIAFISVPFATEREPWRTVLHTDIPDSTNPLYLADVHINHFSRKSFEAMARTAGATHIEYFPYGWLHSYLLSWVPR